jgi:threonylcarbamoyladenosine tRNA methylthiotransferase MtaB
MPNGARTAWTRSSKAVEPTAYHPNANAHSGPGRTIGTEHGQNATAHGGLGRRIGFHTFGCKLNQFETEALASSFKTQGFSIVPFEQEADAYVINTCTVTCRADHKARALIRSLARSRARSLLIVTGCSAELNGGELSSLGENVLVVPQSRKASLLDLPRILGSRGDAHGSTERAGRDIFSAVTVPRDIFSLTASAQNFRTRAYLKVQDGCDSRCSYCRVPLARGPSISLGPGEALKRALELEEQGYREVVITGVNIGSYSAEGVVLHQLLRLLLDATRRVRFRLSSLEPESITEALGRVISSRRVCPHFHISVQSGSDSVLAMMNRRSRSGGIREAVTLLRSCKEDPFIAADIITGFPAETEADFAATRDLAEEISFAALHVFPFSPRPGTAASGCKPAVPERARHRRAQELRSIGRLCASSYSRSWVGRDVEVLLEGRENARTWGVSGNYLKVDVSGVPAADQVEGSIVRAQITSARGMCEGLFLGNV